MCINYFRYSPTVAKTVPRVFSPSNVVFINISKHFVWLGCAYMVPDERGAKATLAANSLNREAMSPQSVCLAW